ncbi:unnamed protein product [Vicia faba]|uniref:Uncharacterized protein n=1 Tax=Vicia faba TaxID=3906 RepID=A0AAV0ZM58_VICFA|nr:unnamed protein product [Vicia faba]
MVVTAHYIDGNWNLQSHILRFIYVPAPHTSENLCGALVECNLKSNVGNENAILLTEMESDDEGELLIDGATSISNSRLEDEDY